LEKIGKGSFVMSRKVREWLMRLRITSTHEERIEIDREIERRKDMYCDDAVERGMVPEEEFLEIVSLVKKRKKKKKEIAYVV
jgi:hypothetical protein